ncbi:MAG: penicillin-binding transpeptidase domain-containing protein [Oscillospiraceae bacterium]
MYLVANDRAGSAYETFGDYGVKVAAKTGTAQLGDNQVNNAIFICYAPYDNPKVAVAVVVEHGSAGASIASIARDFLDAYFTVKTVDTAPRERALAAAVTAPDQTERSYPYEHCTHR